MSKAGSSPSVLAVGDPAPDFSLLRDDGGMLSLSDFAGRKLVLFLFPRADTPGCTTEAQDFSRLQPEFSALGTDVVGLSADSPRKLTNFRKKHGLSVALVSDPSHQVLSAYGAWGEKLLYGRRFEGLLRTTFLIGPDGRITQIWRNVRVQGHAEAVLAAAQSP